MKKKKIAEEFAKSLDHPPAKSLEHPPIEKIILFGSVARGEDGEDSDIDLLVISREKFETKNRVMRKVTDFMLKEEVYISVKVISPDEYALLKNTHFISQIEKEGIRLF
jgi:uncharacterized protein